MNNLADSTDLPVDVRAARVVARLTDAGADNATILAAVAVRMAVRDLVNDHSYNAARIALAALLGIESAR